VNIFFFLLKRKYKGFGTTVAEYFIRYFFILVLFAVVLVLVSACHNVTPLSQPDAGDTETETATDADSDADSDSDTDSDTDTDTDSDTETEVTCEDVPCDVHATCEDGSGEVVCTCDSGFEGDGYTCTDINECLDGGVADCDENASCTNVPDGGGYDCDCNAGWEGDGSVCDDVDGCEGAPCFDGVDCTDVPAPGTGFECDDCPGGYEGNGIVCIDVDECLDELQNDCDAHAECFNVLDGGGYYCECDEGWIGDGVDCDDLDECLDAADNDCDVNATCTNVLDGGGYTCACNTGWDGDGLTCVDFDACDPNPCFTGVECTDEAPPSLGYDCDPCPDGYIGNGESCIDWHECIHGDDECDDLHGECHNLVPGYYCTCEAGWDLDTDGHACVDHDECLFPAEYSCDPLEVCVNLPGGYTCECAFEECDATCCEEGDVCHATSGECCAAATCESLGYHTREWPDGCGHTLECSPWVEIEGGKFLMGAPEPDGWERAWPEHEVTVPSFETWRTEVTVQEYQECIDDGACTEPSTLESECEDETVWDLPNNALRAVNCVYWQQAKDFCEWVGGRLPTEAEWEYVATNGASNDTHPWGSDDPICDLTVMEGCGWYMSQEVCTNSTAGDNDDGLCDLIGNINEWTEDDWHDWGSLPWCSGYDLDGDGTVDAPLDGSAWVDSVRPDYRVARGGGYSTDNDNWLRSDTSRGAGPIDYAMPNVGIRCARDL